jgi:hypothetical protein
MQILTLVFIFILKFLSLILSFADITFIEPKDHEIDFMKACWTALS